MSYLLIDPSERLDFAVDWAAQLGSNDAISATAWSVSPDATVEAAGQDGSSATAFLSGCAFGRVYMLTCRATTAQGRVLERSFTVRCEQR